MRRWRRPEPAAAQPAAAGPPAAAPGAAAAPAPGHDRKDPAGRDYSQPGAAMPAAAAPAATRPRFDAASGAWTGADGKPLWSPNPRMAPPWLTRAMVKAALVAMAAILAWKALGALYPLIMVVVTAIFVALAIEPPVDWLVRKGWRRGLATGAVMVGVFALLGAATAAFGSLLVGQIKDLVEQIPEVYEQVAQWLSKQFGAEIPTQNEALQQVVQSWGSQLAQNAWAVGTQVFSGLISGLGGILLVYYISAQGPKFRATICSPLPPVHQRVVLKVWATAQDKTAGYISSRVILAVINAGVTFAFLSILGVPYALPLSLFAGIVSQFIPTVGPYLGGAAPVLIALIEAPVKGLAVLVFIVAYQQVENFLVAPKLTAKTMEINPAVAFVSVIALGAMLGPVGALLSLPLVATLQAVISTYLHRYELVQDDLLVQDADGRPLPPDPPADLAPSPFAAE